eukprot:UN4428
MQYSIGSRNELAGLSAGRSTGALPKHASNPAWFHASRELQLSLLACSSQRLELFGVRLGAGHEALRASSCRGSPLITTSQWPRASGQCGRCPLDAACLSQACTSCTPHRAAVVQRSAKKPV